MFIEILSISSFYQRCQLIPEILQFDPYMESGIMPAKWVVGRQIAIFAIIGKELQIFVNICTFFK